MNKQRIVLVIFVTLLQSKVLACFNDICYEAETPIHILYTSNSFPIDSLTKIDSLFYPIFLEISKLPTRGWEDVYTAKWINTVLSDCRQIAISKSLFSLLNETERLTINLIAKNIVKYGKISITDTISTNINYFSGKDEYSACSITTNIEKELNNEYIISLNSTHYKMVKLSDNHYVLRAVKEK